MRIGVFWIIVVGTALIAGIWLAIAFENEHDYQIDRHNAEVAASNLATVFDQHVADTISTIDHNLQHFREDYAFDRVIDDRRRLHLLEYVLPGAILHFSVLDQHGHLIYSSFDPHATSRPDMSDTESFVHQRDNPDDELFIGKPVLDRLTGKWIIEFSRKLYQDHAFAGLAVFSLHAMHFTSIDDLDVGKEGAINLVGMDGIVRARLSYAGTRSSFFGATLPRNRPFFDLRQPPKGNYTVASAIDGVERIGAWRRLKQYPLVVLVLLSKAEAMADHAARERASHWLGALLSAIVLSACGAIAWLWRKNCQATVALNKMATTDALTGLANRRCFYQRTTDEVARARRYKRPLTLIMLDIDHFKLVNDCYGHAAGDEVLKIIATLCARSVRKQDLVGRVGGEEFCVLLPETIEAAGVVVAEELRTSLSSAPLSIAGHAVSVTASFGVAELTESDEAPETAIMRADEALYAAKTAGRNRTQAYSAMTKARSVVAGNTPDPANGSLASAGAGSATEQSC